MLVDIVSKNGNLLLNVVQCPDGSLDPEVEQALAELAAWIKITGRDLGPVSFTEPTPVIRPAADGSLKLDAEVATLPGGRQIESRGGRSNVGFRDQSDDRVSWDKVALSAG